MGTEQSFNQAVNTARQYKRNTKEEYQVQEIVYGTEFVVYRTDDFKQIKQNQEAYKNK